MIQSYLSGTTEVITGQKAGASALLHTWHLNLLDCVFWCQAQEDKDHLSQWLQGKNSSRSHWRQKNRTQGWKPKSRSSCPSCNLSWEKRWLDGLRGGLSVNNSSGTETNWVLGDLLLEAKVLCYGPQRVACSQQVCMKGERRSSYISSSFYKAHHFICVRGEGGRERDSSQNVKN